MEQIGDEYLSGPQYQQHEVIMSTWDYIDYKEIKYKSNPIFTCGKSGYSIYDTHPYHPYPSYYGAMIVNKKIAKQMFKDGVNGGYNFSPQKLKVIVLRTKDDFEKATQYPHYAHAVFQKTTHKIKSKDIIILEYPELQNENVNLYEVLKKGITIKQLCCVFDKNEDDILYECYKSLINNIG